jgi:hypothetical protein
MHHDSVNWLVAVKMATLSALEIARSRGGPYLWYGSLHSARLSVPFLSISHVNFGPCSVGG